MHINGVLTVKVGRGGGTGNVRTNAPNAATLPNAKVAVLVPAPDDRATPAASLLKTRLMDRVHRGGHGKCSGCRFVHWQPDEIIIIIAATKVRIVSFFILVPLLIASRIVELVLASETQLAVA